MDLIFRNPKETSIVTKKFSLSHLEEEKKKALSLPSKAYYHSTEV